MKAEDRAEMGAPVITKEELLEIAEELERRFPTSPKPSNQESK